MKDNKLLKTDTKIGSWAFVELRETNQKQIDFTVLSKADTIVDALVSASFGFVLRSLSGSETKSLG